MDEIVTSNQLTGIFGRTPCDKNGGEDLKRGYIVYLEILGNAGNGGIYARTLYKDFPDADKKHHLQFEKDVIAKGNAGGLKGPATLKDPFPAIFDDQIQTVNFGWTPCRVSYILNAPFGAFVANDPAQPLIQPVVFRRDKVVIDEFGKVGIKTYRANHSFFNLEVEPVDGASVLRFDNLMLINANGDALGIAPADETERKSKCYDYCMDIHIMLNQKRLMALFSAPSLVEGETRPAIFEPEFLQKTVTIVFDPPQSNGGGSGPPDP